MLEDLKKTKLQGSMCEPFMEAIMGHSGINVLLQDSSLPIKESAKNHSIFQVVIENPATKHG